MKISVDLTKEYELSMKDDQLNTVVSSIINNFEYAISHYTRWMQTYPELKDMIKIEGD